MMSRNSLNMSRLVYLCVPKAVKQTVWEGKK